MNEEENKNISGENEEQNGRRKVGWFLGRDGESNGCTRKLLFVLGEGKGCMLMEAKWELYSELNKNCFASHVFFLYFSIN